MPLTTETQLPEWVPSGHPAHDILLHGNWDIHPDLFRFEPFKRAEFDWATLTWERLLQTELVGIGLTEHGHGHVFASSDGRIFGSSVIHDAFYFCGKDISDFIRNEKQGVRNSPMIRPDQKSVVLYGVEYFPDDSDLYQYSKTEESCE